jgi:hypothetical protein
MKTEFLQKQYIAWLVPVLCLGIAFLHGIFLYGGSTVLDDAYITYSEAQALSDLKKIVNLNGEAVEQSTSLLHVIILAILHKISNISLPAIGLFFSILMGGFTILAAWRLALFLQMPFAWFVAVFCALFPYLVYWSFGGLEATLVAFIIILLVYSISKLLVKKVSVLNIILLVLSIFAYILSRAEAIFILLTSVIGIASYLFIQNKYNNSTYDKNYYLKLASIGSISLILFTIVSSWRYMMFDQIFPQPVYAKVGMNLLTKLEGFLDYFLCDFWIPSLVILVILGIFTIYKTLVNPSNEKESIKLITLISFIIATLAFLITTGGDWMPGGRFLVPILPLLTILGIYILPKFSKRIAYIILIFLASAAIFDTANFIRYKSTAIPLWLAKTIYTPVLQDFNIKNDKFSWFEKTSQGNLRDIPFITVLDEVVENLLIANNHTPIRILTGQMGMVPFYITQNRFGMVKWIDRAGLVTNYFLKCDLTNHFPKGKVGTFVSIPYVVSHFDEINSRCSNIQRPDIIYALGVGTYFKQRTLGYKIFYVQEGSIHSCRNLYSTSVNEFLAIREDLFNKISKLEPRFYKWPEICPFHFQ